MTHTVYMMLFLCLLIKCGLSLASPLSPIGETHLKAIYIKEEKLLVAADDHSAPREIASGPLEKVTPQWSPDGSKILYAKPGIMTDGNGSTAVLSVIDEKGFQFSEIPILVGKINGVFIAGLRYVEKIGWLDASRVFAVGSVNPNVDEFRIFNIVKNVEQEGYTGFSFAVCHKDGQVAFFEPRFGSGPYLLSSNGQVVARLSTHEDNYSLRFLTWTSDCGKLAVIESLATESNLLILSKGKIEKRLPLPIHPVFHLQSLPDAFLIHGISSKVLVELKNTKVHTSGLEDFSMYKEFERRAAKERLLGTELLDWYPAW